MAGNPLTDPDWAANTTDQVVRLVDNVKSKTTKPAVMAARGLVFGLLAAFLGLFALVLLLVGTTRGLQAAIEPEPASVLPELLTETDPVPVPEPEVLLTSSVPLETVVPPV